MEPNIIKMIDLTQFMLMESTGDSEEKSDLNTGSFLRSHPGFFPEFDDNDNDNNDDDNDDDDAESCSYGSSHEVYENVHQHDDDDDGLSYSANHDDGMDEDGGDDDDDDDDAIDSKMVEVSKKCGAFTMGRRQDCSNTKFLNEKENDKNFWETCLAS